MASAASPQPSPKRRKRNGPRRAPYALAACDNCHGRKLRCSGEKPCERCKKQCISCSYPDRARESALPHSSTRPLLGEFESHAVLRSIDELQLQLREVRARLTERELQRDESAAPLISDALQPKPSPQLSSPDSQNLYAGPTSSTYSLKTADSRLSTIGAPVHTHGSFHNAILETSGSLPTTDSPDGELPSCDESPRQGLIGRLTVEETESCIDTFQAVFDVLHPIPTLATIGSQAAQLLGATRRSIRSQPTKAGDCGLLEMFKIVVATGMVCNEGSPTPLSRALYQSLEPLIGYAVCARTITHNFRILLLLVALYHFACDDLALGARTLLIAARTAVEEGLYRKDKLRAVYPEETEQKSVLNLLWSIFVLDFQFNYAAGLPSMMNDSHVDLPPPVNAPYLSAMVEYVLLGARAWTSIVNKEVLASGRPPSQDALDFFRYQLGRWHQQLDPAVRFDATTIDTEVASAEHPEGVNSAIYLKTLLYLRSNQIQILVLRPVLMHPHTARRECALAREVVEVAQKSITTLYLLAAKGSMYHKRQTVFNHFLGSSLAVLLLAAAHDAEHRSCKGNDEAGTPLLEDTEVLRIGLDLVEQVGATKLVKCFERPRKQLTRLGILRPQLVQYTEANQSTTVEGASGTYDDNVGYLGSLWSPFEFTVDNLDLNNPLFSQSFFDETWI